MRATRAARDRQPGRLAAAIRAFNCEAGCPVVALYDARDRLIAEAHVKPENVEPFIAQLREAAQTGEAMRRPLA